jgi:type II secretory pathway pseudopilin PulG
MVVGVAVIGAVAAIVALAMAIHVAQEEERAFEAQARTLEQRVEARLAWIEAHLAGVEAHLKALSPSSVGNPVGDSRRRCSVPTKRSQPKEGRCPR